MKSYTSDIELLDRIEKMKKTRKEQKLTWSAKDEQVLAFLVELHILRTAFFHSFNEAKKIAEIIANTHDAMQDEKGLLVR